MILVLHFNLDI